MTGRREFTGRGRGQDLLTADGLMGSVLDALRAGAEHARPTKAGEAPQAGKPGEGKAL